MTAATSAPLRWTRSEDGGPGEVLTLVRVDGSGDLAIQVEDEDGAVGLWSLDGDQLGGNQSWTVLSRASVTLADVDAARAQPAEYPLEARTVEALLVELADRWATGSSVVRVAP